MITCLPTKLHRPTLPANFVARPNLVAQLSGGLERGHKLSLVLAPAGFGKTTLVNEWLDALPVMQPPTAPVAEAGVAPTTSGRPLLRGRPQYAWLALDEMDNDLAHFFQYVVTVVQNVFPVPDAESLRLLRAIHLPPVAYLARTLLQDWAALPGACLLVLEDYHTITDTAIHQLLTQLLEHLPRQIHLVILSRAEPPLPLARLRVRQQMTEIRAADLYFSPDETQSFLTQALGRAPAAETTSVLYNQTEGWVAGLQLATLALTSALRATRVAQDEETHFARTFAQNNHHMTTYLVEEVLAQQPPLVQTFLLHTALLERFCAPLAETLLAAADADPDRTAVEPMFDLLGQRFGAPLATEQAILTYLIQTNLFIVPLDAQGEWYRYHHLFRDLLRHHLQTYTSPTALATLHRQASAWLANHGWIEEAIQHALAGGDELAAVHLVAARRHDLLNQEDRRTLERWLALLPETLVQQHPALLMCQAWKLNFQFKLTAIPPVLRAVAARLADPTLTEADVRLLQGESDVLWSYDLYWQNDGQGSLAAAQRALTYIPPSYIYAYGNGLLFFGLAAQMTGRSAVALPLLHATLETPQGAPNALVGRVLFALAYMHYFTGELTSAQRFAQALLEVATRGNLALSAGWAHYVLGVIAYEWNDLATAVQHFTTLVEKRYSSNILTAHNSWLGLAWIEQVRGRFDEAQQQVASLLQFDQEQDQLHLLALVHSFQARLALQRGDVASAGQWAEVTPLPPPKGPLFIFELPLLTRAKVRLAQGTPASLTQALSDLAQLREVAEFTHNTFRLIEILAVQALVEAAQGQTEVALATLQRAVLLAQPERYLRTFVDLGPAMARLLYALTQRNIATDYLGQVLAAFPPSLAQTDPAQQVRRTAQSQLIEPLSERESEVLLYLQQGLANKAIARTLNISALTVKKHTISLYQKLGVQSRQQAVARARALGILPQS